MQSAAHITRHQSPPPNTTARTAPYLRAPDKLLRQHAFDPLVVGVYLAIARCALSLRGPAPLSPADLAAWSDGRRSRDIAVMRRIRRLLDDGWLIAAPGRAVKLRLLPTWGGAALPWRFDDAQSGKPANLRVRRIPIDLLDSYIGRIDPQPGRRPALITRYFNRPLIGLADLGAYAIAAVTDVAPTPQLCSSGLFDAAEPQSPRPLLDLLTDAARQCLTICDGDEAYPITPSVHGWRLLERGERNGSANGSVNGSANGSPNGSRKPSLSNREFAAPTAPESPVNDNPAPHAWDSWDQRIEGDPSPMNSESINGGRRMQSAQHDATTAEREQLLREMGIRNRAALADVPLDLITQWHAAMQHPGFQARFSDPAAFAYTQLRQRIPPPTAAECERWARHATPNNSHYAPSGEDARHATLLARACELAGPGDEQLVGAVLAALIDGMDEPAALAFAQSELAHQAQLESEEVYRALRARATR